MDETKMAYPLSTLEPQGVLTDEVIAGLRALFDERDISEIGTMPVHRLKAEIMARAESVTFPKPPEGVTTGMVAQALLSYLRDEQFVIEQPAQSIPQVLKVITDKAPAQMDLRELLAALAENPSHYLDLLPFIEQQPRVVMASLKSPNWAVVTPGGTLDVSATMERLEQLATHTIIAPRLPDGRYPVPLARAFGREERHMLNPFANSLREAAVRGPIFKHYDLGNLAEEIHLAYIWAAFVVQHQAWPKHIDPYDHLPQAFAEELSERWLAIVEDFRAAKRNGDPTTEGLTRYVQPEDLGSRRPFGGEPERDDEWYLTQLRQYASRAIDTRNQGIEVKERICKGVSTTNGGIKLIRAVVVGHLVTTNGPIRGTGWILQGQTIETTNNSIGQDIYELPPKELYEKAVELGYIKP